MLPRIFDAFAQADDAREPPAGRPGNRSPLARTLVEMHGGRIDAQQRWARDGERIQRAPAPCEPRPAGRQAAPAVAPRDRPHWRGSVPLVVDDSCDTADSLAMMLRVLGSDVRGRLFRDGGAGGACRPASGCRAARHRHARNEWARSGTPHPRRGRSCGAHADRGHRLGSRRRTASARRRRASTIIWSSPCGLDVLPAPAGSARAGPYLLIYGRRAARTPGNRRRREEIEVDGDHVGDVAQVVAVRVAQRRDQRRIEDRGVDRDEIGRRRAFHPRSGRRTRRRRRCRCRRCRSAPALAKAGQRSTRIDAGRPPSESTPIANTSPPNRFEK